MLRKLFNLFIFIDAIRWRRPRRTIRALSIGYVLSVGVVWWTKLDFVNVFQRMLNTTNESVWTQICRPVYTVASDWNRATPNQTQIGCCRIIGANKNRKFARLDGQTSKNGLAKRFRNCKSMWRRAAAFASKNMFCTVGFASILLLPLNALSIRPSYKCSALTHTYILTRELNAFQL